ncbi:TRAP transporter small permease, partial [Acidaminococcus timonensis]|uniref:TRAP transporter small permease n=1 Tax=Acidaminococcus timonensis TaxID=1871002 RepID=UPI0030803E1E
MKLVKWFDKNLELLILAIMLAVMCCLSFANVIMRYGFHHALTWSDEICCYLLALSAFYGSLSNVGVSSNLSTTHGR